MTIHCKVIRLVIIAGLIHCSFSSRAYSEDQKQPDFGRIAFAAPSNLTVKLTEPAENGLCSIDLKWTNNACEPFGALVKVAFDDEARFVILTDAGSEVTEYRHPDLSPGVNYHYLIQPFFGPVSSVAEVTTGAAPEPEVVHEVGPVNVKPAEPSSETKYSIRTPDCFDVAAPVSFSAELNYPTSAILKWNDRAADEEGYAIEISLNDAPFHALALLPPDSTAYQTPPLPEKTHCRFRVRPFFYGTPSALESIATPKERLIRP